MNNEIKINISRVATRSEKVGKKLKNGESQEKSGSLTKFEKVRFYQFNFTNFLLFLSLQMVKN